MTQNDADFGVPGGSAFFVGVGLVPTLCPHAQEIAGVGAWRFSPVRAVCV